MSALSRRRDYFADLLVEYGMTNDPIEKRELRSDLAYWYHLIRDCVAEIPSDAALLSEMERIALTDD